MTPEQLMQRFEPNFKGGSWVCMTLESTQHLSGDVFGFVPVPLVPLLEQLNVIAADLDVQLHIVLQAGFGEIGRADKTE